MFHPIKKRHLFLFVAWWGINCCIKNSEKIVTTAEFIRTDRRLDMRTNCAVGGGMQHFKIQKYSYICVQWYSNDILNCGHYRLPKILPCTGIRACSTWSFTQTCTMILWTSASHRDLTVCKLARSPRCFLPDPLTQVIFCESSVCQSRRPSVRPSVASTQPVMSQTHQSCMNACHTHFSLRAQAPTTNKPSLTVIGGGGTSVMEPLRG